MALVIKLKPGGSVLIGETVMLLESFKRNEAKLVFAGPKEVKINRLNGKKITNERV